MWNRVAGQNIQYKCHLDYSLSLMFTYSLQ